MKVLSRSDQARLNALTDQIDVKTFMKWRAQSRFMRGITVQETRIIWDESPSHIHECASEEFKWQVMRQVNAAYYTPILEGLGSAGKYYSLHIDFCRH
jgi:hypothetical protein